MKIEERLTHLSVLKFAGELDVAYALFRNTKITAVIQQMEIAKNPDNLPVGVDISVELVITEVKVLNGSDGSMYFEGGAFNLCANCVRGGEVGKRYYRFGFFMDMKARTGKGAIW